MGFTADAKGVSWCTRRPARDSGEENALLASLADRAVARVLEVGPGSGARAALLLRRFPAMDYTGFEPSPALLGAARAILAPFAERAAAEGRDLAYPLPVADASQDAAICFDLLEYLRMDQLYMTFNELRRALRPGALCTLRALSPGPGSRGRAAEALHRHFPRLVAGARALELHHYISPEDWEVLDDQRAPEGWLTRQTVMLRRI